MVQLNPAAVKQARSQQLMRTLKSDERDLGAMAELMVRGGGRPVPARSDALAAQLAWVVARRRKLAAHQALANQVHSQLDLVFPGLAGCFADLLGAKAGRVILADICDPDRICRLGSERLRAFVARRGVRLSRPKTAQILDAARAALRLPQAERTVLATVLSADVALLTTLEAELARAESALAQILPATPAAILTSLPGIGVVRASSYGAAIGDPWRFPNAAAAYRASGLVPTEYDSAGRQRRRGQHISREGSVLLRQAIIELGKGLTGHHHDFAAYRRRLIDQDKKLPRSPRWPPGGERIASPSPCCAAKRPSIRPAGRTPSPTSPPAPGPADPNRRPPNNQTQSHHQIVPGPHPGHGGRGPERRRPSYEALRGLRS